MGSLKNLKAKDYYPKTTVSVLVISGELSNRLRDIYFLQLFAPKDRSLVKGLITDKSRGDIGLLKLGLGFLRKRTVKLVLGVIPWKETRTVFGLREGI